ncbi:MAG TPA: DEAD/DEAH box helicase, partial [Spirochaetes bacterium]|nr:DEAD/DEAH box helicase [Spirochaetota bacterium]
LIGYLKNHEAFTGNVNYWVRFDAIDGDYRPWPDYLDRRVETVYRGRGIENLYSHQREACDAVRRGEDPVVVTPTASGKTLCYNLPVLDRILTDPDARALYLFPTKALSQDQLSELHGVITAVGADIKTYTFDGDTPNSARRAIRAAGNIVITNPDMLHAGILPHHPIWVKLFENLQFVVIDEIHSYRGVFGSHFANLMRRLQRVCRFYGANPRFICCSATISNPGEHAESLIGRRVRVIDRNGAPRGERHYVLYNPPVVNRELGIRASAVKEAASVGSLVLNNKIPLIVFARSRMRVEIISTYLKEKCPGLAGRIAAYRGGYLPNERRAIERGLREGKLLGVVSTNALELGIDIGMLDTVITVGYPGSISSLHQQLGRAGRRGKPSLAVIIATSSPLDQYIAGNADFILKGAIESATVNPDNILILMDHMKCAAFELPFSEDERFARHLGTTREMLDYLAGEGILKKAGEKYHWMNETYPANEISLRTAARENFVIVDNEDRSRVIGEIDYYAAPEFIHDDAIYLHQGRQYYINRLDWESRMAFCHEVESDYFTDAETKTDIHVMEKFGEKYFEGSLLCRGEVNVRNKTVMFKKIRFNTHENLGWGKIHLPELEMHTSSSWIDFDEDWLAGLAGKPMVGQLLYSVAYILRNIVPLYTLSDVSDIRVTHQTRSGYSGKPAVFIYDSVPGGVGIADRVFEILPLIAEESARAVKACPCSRGYPGCIGPLPSENAGIKQLTAAILDGLRHEHTRQT